MWNEQHKCYVYENKPFDPHEFNAIAEAVFKKNHDLRPCVRVVGDEAEMNGVSTPPTVPASEYESLKARYKSLQARIGGPEVPAPEITLEAALAVVQRLAPERLRKTHTTGRAKQAEQMAVA